jgi:hypothetical protein
MIAELCIERTHLDSIVPAYLLSRKVANEAKREKKTPKPKTTP